VAATDSDRFSHRSSSVIQELAGLGGDVRFVKQEVAAQLNLPLGKTRCVRPLFAVRGG
jgi:phosphopantetheine adenylyltransferase